MIKTRLEKAIQTEIIKKLREYGEGYKHPPYPKGIPDIHFLSLQGNLWFEVKRTASHKPSKIQVVRHRRMRRLGQKVFVVWSWKQVKKILKEHNIEKRR